VIGPEGSANVLQLAIQAVTSHRCEVERNFPVESFSLHLPLTLATTVFEPMVLPGPESDFHARSAQPEATAITLSTSDARDGVSSMTIAHIQPTRLSRSAKLRIERRSP
jgi:hypothetical protein